MKDGPAFQLYASDFYIDTAGWTATEVGAYFRLLMCEWTNGALSPKISDLARVAGVDPRNMQKMWSAVIAKKFTTNDANMLVNKRLEEVREAQRKFRESQSKKGKARAAQRWGEPIAPATNGLQPNHSSSSSSSSSVQKHITSHRLNDARFDEFWTEYPSKKGRKPCAVKYARIMSLSKSPDASHGQIMAGLRKLKAECRKWKEGFYPNPLTFLNQERWNDEPEGPSTRASPMADAKLREEMSSCFGGFAGKCSARSAWKVPSMPRCILCFAVHPRGE